MRHVTRGIIDITATPICYIYMREASGYCRYAIYIDDRWRRGEVTR